MNVIIDFGFNKDRGWSLYERFIWLISFHEVAIDLE